MFFFSKSLKFDSRKLRKLVMLLKYLYFQNERSYYIFDFLTSELPTNEEKCWKSVKKSTHYMGSSWEITFT